MSEARETPVLRDPKDYQFAFEQSHPICPKCFCLFAEPVNVPKSTLPVVVMCYGEMFKAVFYFRQWTA